MTSLPASASLPRTPKGAHLAWSLCLALAALGLARPVLGKEPPTVHLDYERAANAADCPEQASVENAVRARLGYDPFREPAEVLLLARVAREGEELRGRIVMSTANRQAGERLLVSRRADCAELAAAMDLALSIAIDPLSIAREPTAPSSIVVISSPPPAPEKPPVAAAAPPRHVEALVGLTGSLGETVSATAGVLAGLGLRSERWSLSLEGRANLPRAQTVGGGHIDVGTLSGTIAPCLHRGMVGGCALLTIAAIRGSGEDLSDANQATTPFVQLGARALLELPLGRMVAARVHLDLSGPLTRTTLKVGGNAVWTSPPVNVALGLVGLVRFR